MGLSDPAGLGRRVRELRVAEGWRQAELAQHVGISPSYLSRIEAGQREPTPPVLETLGAALGVTTEQLLTGVIPQRADRVRHALAGARMLAGTGQAEQARRGLEELIDEARAAGDRELLAEVQVALAEATERSVGLTAAIALWESVRAEAAVGGERWMRAVVALLRCYRDVGDLGRAVDLGEQALLHLEQLGLRDVDDGIRVAVTLVSAYFERGDVIRAQQLAQDTVTRAERAGDPSARASAYWNASVVTADLGDVAGAARMGERAVALLGEGTDDRNLGRVRVAQAELLLRVDPPRVAEARRLLTDAERKLQAVGSRSDLAHVAVQRSRACLAAGDAEGAHRQADTALDLLGDEADLEVAAAHAMHGRAYALSGELRRAGEAFRRAVAVLIGAQAGRRAAALWAELATWCERAGDLESAMTAYRAATAAAGLLPEEASGLPVAPGTR